MANLLARQHCPRGRQKKQLKQISSVQFNGLTAMRHQQGRMKQIKPNNEEEQPQFTYITLAMHGNYIAENVNVQYNCAYNTVHVMSLIVAD